ncbi:unnamed protein product, partial [Effrenium voratum]
MAMCIDVASSPLGAEGAAEELCRALHGPLSVRWQVPLENGFVAALQAQLQEPSESWPPRQVQLQLARPGLPALEMQVPSASSPQQLATLITAARRVAEGRADEVPPEKILEAELEVVDECQERKIAQPLSIRQWHHGVCGHHALFNLRCMLRGDLDALRDEPKFWQQALADMQRLANFGEQSGRWPRRPGAVWRGRRSAPEALGGSRRGAKGQNYTGNIPREPQGPAAGAAEERGARVPAGCRDAL